MVYKIETPIKGKIVEYRTGSNPFKVLKEYELEEFELSDLEIVEIGEPNIEEDLGDI